MLRILSIVYSLKNKKWIFCMNSLSILNFIWGTSSKWSISWCYHQSVWRWGWYNPERAGNGCTLVSPSINEKSYWEQEKFNILFVVAQIVLLIPYSNDAIEHLFSLVNKNKNQSSYRNHIDQDKTLSSILAVKLDRPDTSSTLCYEFQSDKELLGMA